MDVLYPVLASGQRLLPLTPNQTLVIETLRARNHSLTLSIHWTWRNGYAFPLDDRIHLPGLKRRIWQGNTEAYAAQKKRDNPPLYTGANDLRAWLLWALGEGLTTVEEATSLTSGQAIEGWYGDLLLRTNYYVNALREDTPALRRCRECDCWVNPAYGEESPAKHLDHEGTEEDPRAPGDYDDICDVCCYS